MPSSALQSPGARPDSRGYQSSSSTRIRSHSISSDRPSTSGYGNAMSPPPNIEPMPVYIAASAASQIITSDHDSRCESWADEHGIEPSPEAAYATPGALRLVNTFLDQLLFSFLTVSKSTSLAALRPAVAEVLKPKLAKEAISRADEELNEYLGGVEEDDTHDGLDSKGEWDLELVWKRTRLRCMVYSSLGDMEEDDEDRYTELEQLDGPAQSPDLAIVSPAVAIFLTSILEYMGEQALIAAGQAAFHRIRMQQRKDEKEGNSACGNIADRTTLEQADMERVALDRTLGRIWRGWKKRVRGNESISYNIQQAVSREAMQSRDEGRRNSVQAEQNARIDDATSKSVASELEEAKIPLPMSDNDIDEIEIPGLTSYSDDEEEAEVFTTRPKSMMIFTSNKGLPTPNSSQPSTPKFLSSNSRKRSYSLPSPAQSNLSPLKRQKSSLVGTLHSEEPSKSATATHSRNASKDSQIAGVAANVLALGAAAIAGIAAVAKGEAPQTTPFTEDGFELGEEPEEEVEIMTSSRVSITSPLDLVNSPLPNSGKSSRSASVRSRAGSVASVRIVDVPRSPAPRLDDGSPRPGMNRRVSSGLHISVPASPDTYPSASSSAVQRASLPAPTIKVPSPLNREVSKTSTSLTEATASEPAPPPVAVPTRSPLRERPSSQTESPKDDLPTEQAQFANGINGDHSTFVLATAPPPRSSRDMKAGASPTFSAAPASQRMSQQSTYSAAPPLTPLRELVEATHDTSEDDASFYSRPSDVSGRIEPTPRSRTSTSDRSARGKASPVLSQLRENDATPKSEAYNKGTRQARASGSSSSSVDSYKPRPIRLSEDDVPSPKIGENAGKSFDDLLSSKKTLQYTLTPQSMRNLQDTPPSPNVARPIRPRTTSNHSATKVSGFLAADTPPLPSPTASHMTVRSVGGTRSRIAVPRDARVENESITDFADFIRSTGPPKGRDDFAKAPPMSPRATSSSSNVPRPNSSVPRSVPITTPLSIRTNSSSGRARLQARDAVVQADATSDLIDFIRQGPQSEGARISRTIAPFRTTMDSDQVLTSHRNRLSTLPEVRDSVTTTISVAPSMQSSTGTVNSGTALLGAHKKAGVAKAPAPTPFTAFPEEDDMMPKRTRRRVRDPYAIDFSDEDDEDFYDVVPTAKPKQQEESLMDFLNSAPPPSPQTPQPFDLGNMSVVTAPPKKEKRSFWGRKKKVDAV